MRRAATARRRLLIHQIYFFLGWGAVAPPPAFDMSVVKSRLRAKCVLPVQQLLNKSIEVLVRKYLSKDIISNLVSTVNCP